MKESKTIHFFHQLGPMPRFLIALTAAAIVFFLTNNNSASIQSISVWITFALATLLLEGITMFTAHPREITHIVKKQDFSRILIFLIILVASFVSLFAIVALLRRMPNAGEKGYYYHIVLFVGSVVSSWFLIHTVFAFRYAHLFYTGEDEAGNVEKQHRGGMIFPNEKKPDYLDFAYFSFVLGMTFQVSDVQITSSNIRRLALLHGLLSFLFNTVILAISINIIAALIQK